MSRFNESFWVSWMPIGFELALITKRHLQFSFGNGATKSISKKWVIMPPALSSEGPVALAGGVARHLLRPVAVEWLLLKVRRSAASPGDKWQDPVAAFMGLQNLTGCTQSYAGIQGRDVVFSARCRLGSVAACMTAPHCSYPNADSPEDLTDHGHRRGSVNSCRSGIQGPPFPVGSAHPRAKRSRPSSV